MSSNSSFCQRTQREWIYSCMKCRETSRFESPRSLWKNFCNKLIIKTIIRYFSFHQMTVSAKILSCVRYQCILNLFSTPAGSNPGTGTAAIPAGAGDRGMWQEDSSSLGGGAGWDRSLEKGEAATAEGHGGHEGERKGHAGSGTWHTYKVVLWPPFIFCFLFMRVFREYNLICWICTCIY